MDSLKEISRNEYIARINRVVSFIDANIADKLTLGKLSEISCFSPFHFHRVFHAYIGETPNDFVNRIRLEKAATFLSYNTSDTITDVALKYGFSSSAAFARAFKKHFGKSATDWRNGGFLNYKNSKICKTDSKMGKEALSLDDYVSSINNLTVNNNQEENKMEVEIKQMPRIHVAYISVYSGYDDKIGIAFDKLCRWAGPRGLLTPETKFVGVAFDSPDVTPQDKLRYNACITVPEGTKPEKDINITDIAEARCITARYSGPQEGISKFYDELFKVALPENGFLPDDMPEYEIYLNDPKSDPDKKFVMDVYIPVKPL